MMVFDRRLRLILSLPPINVQLVLTCKNNQKSINNLRRALFVSLSNCCPVERSSLGKDVLRQLDKLAADLSHLSLSSWPSQECQVDQIAVDEVGNVWGTGTMMEQCQAQSMATFNNNHTNYADHDDNGGDVMQQTCQAENMFGVAMSPHLNNGNSGLCMLVADANRRRSFGDEPDSLLRYLDDADLGRAQQQLSAGYPMSSRLYRDRDTIVNGGANNSDNDDFAGWSSSETQLSPLSGFLSSAGISTTTASTAGTPASTVGAQCAESVSITRASLRKMGVGSFEFCGGLRKLTVGSLQVHIRCCQIMQAAAGYPWQAWQAGLPSQSNSRQ